MDKNLHGRAWLRQPWAPRRPFTLRLREVTVLVNILSLVLVAADVECVHMATIHAGLNISVVRSIRYTHAMIHVNKIVVTRS